MSGWCDLITSRDTTGDTLTELAREKNCMPFRLQLISVGGPKETVKLRVKIILVSASPGVSRDSFMLGSTVGPAIV